MQHHRCHPPLPRLADNSISHLPRPVPSGVHSLLALLGVVGSPMWEDAARTAPALPRAGAKLLAEDLGANPSPGQAMRGIRHACRRHERCDCGYCDCDARLPHHRRRRVGRVQRVLWRSARGCCQCDTVDAANVRAVQVRGRSWGMRRVGRCDGDRRLGIARRVRSDRHHQHFSLPSSTAHRAVALSFASNARRGCRFRVKDLAQHHADEEAPNTGTAGSSSSFSSSPCSSSATGARPFSQPQEIARQA